MIARKLLPLFLILILFTSCKNRVQKSYEFINEYNNASELFNNNLIYRTEAKIIGERILEEVIIEINYDLSLKKVDCETNFGVKILPRSICYALIKGEAGELINEGAIINLTFRSFDNFILSKATLDKKAMEKLLSENQTYINEDLDFGTDKNPELVKTLATINKDLPIENEFDNTKLLKIKLDKYNNINCITEVPDDFAESLKNPETISRLKKIILKRKNDQFFMELKRSYGISKIIYSYQNPKGELIEQIILE